jgi:hypothetical protein
MRRTPESRRATVMNDSVSLLTGVVSAVLVVVLYVWQSLALSALFRKAGEAGWKGWVPLYNLAVLLQLGGFSPWFIFIVFVPLFGVVALVVLLVIAFHRINRAFGLGAGMTVLAALLFLVWASVVGFGSARWIGAEGRATRTSAEQPAPVFADYAAPVPPRDAAFAPVAWSPEPAAPTPPPAGAPSVPPPPPPTVATPVVPAFAPPPRDAQPPASPRPLASEIEDSAVDSDARFASGPRRTGPVPVLPGPAVPQAPPAFSPPPAPAPAAATEAPGAAPTPPSWLNTDPAVPAAPAPTSAPAAAWRPPEGPDEAFPELSEAVSAVVGAPDAGAPRSARSSVSALYAEPAAPEPPAFAGDDDPDEFDHTVVARRRRIPWVLIPPGGGPVDISSDVVILGRRPAADPAYPGAQLVSISDETRTVSKTHARLERRDDTWYVTDLGSTNGVLFATLMGTEVEAQPGQEIEAGERFFLGDAEVRLTRAAG